MSANSSPAAPIAGVSALVVHAGRLLVVRRGRPPLQGRWALPGGRIESGETAAAAVVREVCEETAIAVEAPEEIAHVVIESSESPGLSFALTVFRCRFVSGTPQAGDDAAEARWVTHAEFARLPVAEQTRTVAGRFWPETAHA